MTDIQQFAAYTPTWCPGCGNWGIGSALKKALAGMNMSPSSLIAIFGIGCSGNMNDFLNAYAFHSLHGRAIPNAVGAKLANNEMPVIVVAGDGDTYGEGGNHFLHACRGNHDITLIVHDNGVYGLTTGQAAPTAQKGFKAKSTPTGIIEVSVNPLALALAEGATFIAQGFAGDMNHASTLIAEGMKHKGLSLVNILQPCVTFNHINTYQYYLPRVYKLPENYDKTDAKQALLKTWEMNEEKFPLGIIYESSRPAYTEELQQLGGKPLIKKSRFEQFNDLFNDFI